MLSLGLPAHQDYFTVYNQVLASCDHPVILHWLGEMFDPQLSGYWGAVILKTLNVVIEIVKITLTA